MRGLTFLSSLIALLIASTAAQAEWRGFSTADVNLRDGPGTRYGVVDVVPEGVRIFVDHCRRGWCAVDYRGEEGWMSRDYLARERIRNSRHLKENDRLEYDGQDYRERYYDDGNYREVIVVDPPRYRDGRRRGERRRNRQVREGGRSRDGRRGRHGRRVREEANIERPVVRRPGKVRKRSGNRNLEIVLSREGAEAPKRRCRVEAGCGQPRPAIDFSGK